MQDRQSPLASYSQVQRGGNGIGGVVWHRETKYKGYSSSLQVGCDFACREQIISRPLYMQNFHETLLNDLRNPQLCDPNPSANLPPELLRSSPWLGKNAKESAMVTIEGCFSP
jgi:hypothetical protein